MSATRSPSMRCLLTAVLTAALAQGSTVMELAQTVRAGIATKRADADVADDVRRVVLTQRLEEAAIEQLQSEGAGPLTFEELERLRDASESLPAPSGLRLFDAP